MIEIRNLSFRYPSGQLALQEVSLTIREKERTALVGPSGAGKSTLLMHCNGLLPTPSFTEQSRAAVFVGNSPVVKSTLRDIRRRVAFLFQDPDDQLFCPTVREDVAFGPLNLGLGRDEVQHRVDRCLEAVGMSDCLNRNPSELSTGERKRICLAGLFACEPDVLVLDEPTSNLDPRARSTLLGILRSFPGTLVMATHDLDFVIDLCERVLVLDRGKLQADGSVERILSDPLIMDRHGLEVPWRLRKERVMMT